MDYLDWWSKYYASINQGISGEKDKKGKPIGSDDDNKDTTDNQDTESNYNDTRDETKSFFKKSRIKILFFLNGYNKVNFILRIIEKYFLEEKTKKYDFKKKAYSED